MINIEQYKKYLREKRYKENPTKVNLNTWDKIGGGIVELGNNVTRGLLKAGEGILDAVTGVGAWTADKLGADTVSDSLERATKYDLTDKFMDLTNKYNDTAIGRFTSGQWMFSREAMEQARNNMILPDIVDATAQGLGNAVGNIAIGSVLGPLGKGTQFLGIGLSAGGSTLESELQQGRDINEATVRGAMMGTVEALSERFVGDFVNKIGSKIVGSGAKKLASTTGGKIATHLISNMAEEGFEEVASDLAEPITQMIAYKEERTGNVFKDYSRLFQENGGMLGVAEDFLVGALSSALMGGAEVTTGVLSQQGGITDKVNTYEIQLSVNEMLEVNNKIKEAEMNGASVSEIARLQLEYNNAVQKVVDETSNKIDELATVLEDENAKREAEEYEKLDDEAKVEYKASKLLERYNNAKNLTEARNKAILPFEEQQAEQRKNIVEEKANQYLIKTEETNDKNIDATYDKNSGVLTINNEVYKDHDKFVKTVMHEIGMHGTGDLDSVIDTMSKNEKISKTIEEEFSKYKKLYNKEINASKKNGTINNRINELMEKENISKKEATKKAVDWYVKGEIVADNFNVYFNNLNEFFNALEGKNKRNIISNIRNIFKNREKPSNYKEVIKALNNGAKDSLIITKKNVKDMIKLVNDGNERIENNSQQLSEVRAKKTYKEDRFADATSVRKAMRKSARKSAINNYLGAIYVRTLSLDVNHLEQLDTTALGVISNFFSDVKNDPNNFVWKDNLDALVIKAQELYKDRTQGSARQQEVTSKVAEGINDIVNKAVNDIDLTFADRFGDFENVNNNEVQEEVEETTEDDNTNEEVVETKEEKTEEKEEIKEVEDKNTAKTNENATKTVSEEEVENNTTEEEKVPKLDVIKKDVFNRVYEISRGKSGMMGVSLDEIASSWEWRKGNKSAVRKASTSTSYLDAVETSINYIDSKLSDIVDEMYESRQKLNKENKEIDKKNIEIDKANKEIEQINRKINEENRNLEKGERKKKLPYKDNIERNNANEEFDFFKRNIKEMKDEIVKFEPILKDDLIYLGVNGKPRTMEVNDKQILMKTYYNELSETLKGKLDNLLSKLESAYETRTSTTYQIIKREKAKKVEISQDMLDFTTYSDSFKKSMNTYEIKLIHTDEQNDGVIEIVKEKYFGNISTIKFEERHPNCEILSSTLLDSESEDYVFFTDIKEREKYHDFKTFYIKHKVDKAKARLNKTQVEINSLKSELGENSSNESTLNQSLKNRTKSLSTAMSKNNKERVEELTKEISELTENLTNLNNERLQIEDKIAVLENDILIQQNEVNKLVNIMDTREASLNLNEVEKKFVEQKVATVRQISKDTLDKISTILSREIYALENQIKSMISAEVFEETKTKYEDKLKELKKSLKLSKEENAELEKKNKELSDYLNNASQELELVQKDINSMSAEDVNYISEETLQELQDLTDSKNTLMQEVETYKKNEKSTKKDILNLRNQIDKLTKSIEKYTNKIEEVKTKYEDIKNTLKESKQSVKDSENSKKKVEKELSKKEKENEKLQGKIEKLEEKVSALKEKSVTNVNEIKKENDKLKKLTLSNQALINKLNNEVDNLKSGEYVIEVNAKIIETLTDLQNKKIKYDVKKIIEQMVDDLTKVDEKQFVFSQETYAVVSDMLSRGKVKPAVKVIINKIVYEYGLEFTNQLPVQTLNDLELNDVNSEESKSATNYVNAQVQDYIYQYLKGIYDGAELSAFKSKLLECRAKIKEFYIGREKRLKTLRRVRKSFKSEYKRAKNLFNIKGNGFDPRIVHEVSSLLHTAKEMKIKDLKNGALRVKIREFYNNITNERTEEVDGKKVTKPSLIRELGLNDFNPELTALFNDIIKKQDVIKKGDKEIPNQATLEELEDYRRLLIGKQLKKTAEETETDNEESEIDATEVQLTTEKETDETSGFGGLMSWLIEEYGERKSKLGDGKYTVKQLSQIAIEKQAELSKYNLKFGRIVRYVTDPRVALGFMDGFNEGGIYSMFYEELRKAQNNFYDKYMNMFDHLERFIEANSKEIAHFRKEATVEGITGDRYFLLSLYAQLDQADSFKHIVKNGITYTKDNKGKQTINKQFDGNEKERESQWTIYKSLLEKELHLDDSKSIESKYLAETRQIFGLGADMIREADLDIFGFSHIPAVTEVDKDGNPKRDNKYIGIVVSDEQFDLDLENNSNFFGVTGSVKFKFNFKRTSMTGAVKIIPLNFTLETYMKNASQYATFNPTIVNISQIYNFKQSNGTSLKSQSDLTWGRKGNMSNVDRFLIDLLKDMQGVRNSNGGVGSKVLSKIRSAFTKFSLYGNVKVAVSQVASLPASFKYIDPQNVVKGLNYYSLWNKEYPLPTSGKYRDYNRGLLKTYNFGQQTLNIIDKVGSWGITATDSFTIKRIWGGALAQCSKEVVDADGNKTVEVDYEKAVDLFNRTVEDTQPNYQPLFRSAMMRDTNEFVRLFTAFKTDGNKNFSNFSEAWLRMYAKKKQGQKITKSDVKYLTRTHLALLSEGIIYTLIGVLFRLALDKDDDDDKEVLGIVETFVNENIIGALPFINNFEFDFDGDGFFGKFKFDELSFSYLDFLKDSLEEVKTLFADGTVGEKIQTIANMSGKLLGIPTRNIMNQAIGLTKLFNKEAGYKLDSFWNGYDLTSKATINYKMKYGYSDQAYRYYKMYNDNQVVLGARVNKELFRLYQDGYTEVIIKPVGSYIEYNGEQYEVDDKIVESQYNNLKTTIAKFVNSAKYSRYSDEERAYILKKVITAYYNKVVSLVVGKKINDLTTFLSSGYQNYYDTILYLDDINAIKSTTSKTKKELVTEYINKLKISKAEKYLLYMLAGYKLSDDKKKTVKQFLILKGIKKDVIKELLE